MAIKKPKLGSGKRFEDFVDKLMKEGYTRDQAEKIAAAKGREKYGKKKFQGLAAKGKPGY